MAYLTLEDGTIFKGEAFGARRDVMGEVVFHTGMTGYQEMLTDPACHGQILAMTYPIVGNYGVNGESAESGTVQASALVAREICEYPSNWKCEGSLLDYCETHGVVGLMGIDTRELTRALRDKGAMRGIITKTPPSAAQIEEMKARADAPPVGRVTTEEPYAFGEGEKRVAVLDFGVRRSMLRGLCERGCALTVFPARTGAESVLAGDFDGVALSGGPGDPKQNPEIIENIAKLAGKLPVLGVGLGHQLLALAMGADTRKLKYGHRGGNHPVKDMQKNRVSVTSQNHGYVIVNQSLPGCAVVSHKSWNDRSIEGVKYVGYPMFSVQFEPGADTAYVYDDFIALMEGRKQNAALRVESVE